MAQDIGLLLRGLGASFSNQVPQFRQQMAQEQEAQMQQQEFQAQQAQRAQQGQMQDFEMMQARQQASFQDADAALRLAATGNYEAIIALAEDRMQLDQRLGGPMKGDNTAMLANMARRAAMGDAQAASQLNLQLAGIVEQGLARGVLQKPEVERDKGVVVGGRVVNPYTGDVIAEFPAEAAVAPAPTPQSPIGRLQSDITAGFIPSDLGQQLISSEMAAAQGAQAAAQQQTQSAATQQQLMNDEALRALSITESLISNPNLKSAVGAIQGQYVPTFRAGTADVEVAFDELKNLLTMGNLERMTGVLSESDIKLIASAASGLDLRMSDAAAASKLNEIKSRLVMRLKEKGLIPPDYGTPGVFSGQVQRSGVSAPLQGGTQTVIGAPTVINGYTITEVRGD